MNEIKNHWKKWLYWFFLGVAIIVVYKLLDNFNDVIGVIGRFIETITPFLAGILMAYILYLPCRKIETAYKKSKSKFIKKKARGLSVITVYLIVLLLIIVLINFILPVVFESVVDFMNNIQGYYEIAIQNYNNLPEDSFIKGEMVNELMQSIKNIDIKQYLNLDKMLEYVMSAIKAVTSIVDVFVTVIVSIYILVGRTEIIKGIKRLLGATLTEKTYQNINKYFNDSNQIFFKFLASQFLDAVIVGILVTIALSIMGVRYAPLLGFLIGIFNMIPYVGAIFAGGLATLITLITGGLSQAIWMLIVVIVLQQIDANIISPRIMKHSLKISPLFVIFAISVGGTYFGVLGMFLAVPVIAVIKILLKDFVESREKEKIK